MYHSTFLNRKTPPKPMAKKKSFKILFYKVNYRGKCKKFIVSLFFNHSIQFFFFEIKVTNRQNPYFVVIFNMHVD